MLLHVSYSLSCSFFLVIAVCAPGPVTTAVAAACATDGSAEDACTAEEVNLLQQITRHTAVEKGDKIESRGRELRGGASAWLSLSRRAGSEHSKGCPVDYDVPLDNHHGPSPLHIASVSSFVDVADAWWTESRVKKYEQPVSEQPYKIAPSPISGCGMWATKLIKKGERVGPVWVQDEDEDSDLADYAVTHFTPWFGRAVNHCPTGQNTHLEQHADNSVWAVANEDILLGQELIGNYDEAHAQFPRLVSGADPSWKCPTHEA